MSTTTFSLFFRVVQLFDGNIAWMNYKAQQFVERNIQILRLIVKMFQIKSID